LLIRIIKDHAHASGNRSMAWVVVKSFIRSNGEDLRIEHDEDVFTGIREGFYNAKEIKKWLRGNAIRKFER
jgi:prophage maintenance system killer protein